MCLPKVHKKILLTISLLFLSVLACSLPQVNSPEQPVSVPTNANVESETPPTQPVPPTIKSDLAIKEILLRYDGATGAGTVEILLCNLGPSTASHFELEFDIAGTVFRVMPQVTLDENVCDSFYPTDFLFGNAPIEAEGIYHIRAKVFPSEISDPTENNQKEVDLDINRLSASIPQNLLDEYNQCMAGSSHDDCSVVLAHYPVSNPHEVMKVSENYLSIAPIAYENLATSILVDNMICVPIQEKFLGIKGPEIVAERIVIGEYIGGYTATGHSIYVSGDEAMLEESNNRTDFWLIYLQGQCLNAHEMTHFLLGDVPMPVWLNEGLATYMASPEQSNMPDMYQVIECREKGWFGTDYEGINREVPYENLGGYNPDTPGIYYYYTASCFWHYIEDTYGTEKIQEILRKTVEYRNPKYNGCRQNNDVYFIRDIVNPVLGTDISPLTQERWGFGSTFTGCE